ncbi:serine-protein kinase ATM-like isoform X3 [Hydractinia symbiolongicarpus]|uniref:serine-protein kinase ATM-like isoform X3 n=1 Tax=Hydractinia symbiolongicarpus TaxID=13093 RepID=UPI00254F996B|nr:serine-protein kinase ATM-like isoform X3 [Hydractinia symbiolongicarpus]
MARLLANVSSYCSGLLSEKSTVRKQAATKLAVLLKDQEIIKALDCSSNGAEKSDNSTWEGVIRCVGSYVYAEIDFGTCVKSTNFSVRKHQEAAELYQYVVQTAEKRNHLQKASPLLTHVLTIISSVHGSSPVVIIYSNVMLKSILSNHKHCCELGVSRWHEFTRYYFQLLLEPLNSNIHILCAKVLVQLLMIADKLPYIDVDGNVEYFIKVFHYNRHTKHFTILELLLKAVCTFASVSYISAQKSIYILGDTLFPVLRCFWHYEVLSIKISLVHFFKVLTIVYSMMEEAGIEDTDTTHSKAKKFFEELYEIVYVEFEQFKNSECLDRSVCDTDEIIFLAAATIKKVMANLSTKHTSSKKHKKFKATIKAPWDAIVDGICKSNSTKSYTVWLRVIVQLLKERENAVFSKEQTNVLISTFVASLDERSSDATRSLILEILCAILDGYFVFFGLTEELQDHVKELKSAMDFSKSKVNEKHLNNLIGIIIKIGCMECTDAFNYVIYSGCKPTNESVKMLFDVLQRSFFPENYDQYVNQTVQQLKLREQLISWLLPLNEDVLHCLQCLDRESFHIYCSLLAALVSCNPVEVGKALQSWFEQSEEYVFVEISGKNSYSHIYDHKDENMACGCNCIEKHFLKKNLLSTKIVNFLEKRLKDVLAMISVQVAQKSDENSLTKILAYWSGFSAVVFKLHNSIFHCFTNNNASKMLMNLFNIGLGSMILLLKQVFQRDIAKKEKIMIINQCLEKLQLSLMLLCKELESLGPLEELIAVLMNILQEKDLNISQEMSFSAFSLQNVSTVTDEREDCDTFMEELEGSKNFETVKGKQRQMLRLCYDILAKVLFAYRRFSKTRDAFMDMLKKPQNGLLEESTLLMLSTVCEVIEQGGNNISSKECINITHCIRNQLSFYRSDQNACLQLLLSIKIMIKFLFGMDDEHTIVQSRSILIKIIKTFWLLRNEKYCPHVRIRIASVLEILAKVDKDNETYRMKVHTSSSSGKQENTAADMLYEMLLDQDINVKIDVAGRMGTVLNIVSVELQENHFISICKILDKLASNGSKTLCIDGFLHVNLTILVVIKDIILKNVALENKALWILFEFSRNGVLRQANVKKLLECLSKYFGYNNLKDYMQPKMGFLLYNTIKNNISTEEFPTLCLGLDHKDFFRNYCKEIFSYLVFFNKFEDINKIHHKFPFVEEKIEMLINHFASIVALSLPLHCEQINNKLLEINKSIHLRGLDHFRSTLTTEIFNKELKYNIEEIVFNLSLHMYDVDEENKTKCPKTRECTSYYPAFTSFAISDVLLHLASGYRANIGAIGIFIKYPNVTVNVLMRLAIRFCTAKRFSDKVISLKTFNWFARFIVQYLKEFEESCGNYVIRELVHRVLYFMEEKFDLCQQNLLDNICFDLLEFFCKEAIMYEYSRKELKKHLNFIIDMLLIFISGKSPLKRSRSFQLLDILSITFKDFLKLDVTELLEHLQSYPQRHLFATLEERLLALQSTDQNPQKQFIYLVQQMQNKSIKRKHFLLQKLQKLLQIHAEKLDVSHDVLSNLIGTITKCCHSHELGSELLTVDCLGLLGRVNRTYQTWENLDIQKKNHQRDLIDAAVTICISKNASISGIALESLQNMLVTHDVKSYEKTNENFIYVKSFLNNKRDSLKSSLKSPSNASFIILPHDQLSIHSKLNCEDWLRILVDVLMKVVQSNFLVQTDRLCQVHTLFGNLCLPVLLQDVLQKHDNQHVMTQFFNKWVNSFLALKKNAVQKKDAEKKMIVLINLIQELRRHNVPSYIVKTSTPWDNNFWLDINYNEYANAAFHCSLYYAAAMFLEIACDSLRKNDMFEYNSNNKPTDLICQVYESIGEEDYIYGLAANNSVKRSSRFQQYQLQKQFQKALLMNDVESSTRAPNVDIPNILLKCGLCHSAWIYLNGLPDQEKKKLSEVQFEAAWRNSIWNDVEIRSKSMNSTGYHKSLYHSINSLYYWDYDQFAQHVRNVKLNIVNEMSRKVPNPANQQVLLSRCFTINQLERVGFAVLRSEIHELNFPSKWSHVFDFYDVCFSAVSEALKIACQHTPKNLLQELLLRTTNFVQSFCKHARKEKRFEVAERIISTLHSLEQFGSLTLNWKLEEAKLFWDKGEQTYALKLLESLKESNKADKSYPIILGLYGYWLGETRSQNPVRIMNDYLQPAIEIMTKNSYDGFYSPIRAYFSLAKYADCRYQDISGYMKSHVHKRKQSVTRTVQIDIKHFKSSPSRQHDVKVKRHYKNLEKQCEEDEKEILQLYKDQNGFLEKAVYNYVKCLECGDKFDLEVLRLCALWFEHYMVESVNRELKSGFPKIESRKFLIALYQIAARLGMKVANEFIAFKSILENLVERCVLDHPHHSIFILMALCNAEVHLKTKKRGKCSYSSSNNSDPAEQRTQASKNLFERVRKNASKITYEADLLSKAYLQLAEWDIGQWKNERGPFKIPEHKLVRKINCLFSVAIPTLELKIDPLCKYSSIIYITKFDSTFNHAGGINLPKIISCLGSDGKWRKQLVKGRDDLRQDAVMQQVFGLVNILLWNNPDTKRKSLHMKTYKVVPLSSQSGLMEWCDGTIPLGNYLIGVHGGQKGAHQRYYPNDWTVKECRKRLTNATLHGGTCTKHDTYLEIAKNFRPVFRHFFFEKFGDPFVWFLKRLSYTKSVAVSSVVGYIVGLGDRHCQNILIDCNSAEVVHIDLGVAFEQGKLLPTPETVPFRLTRDVVDGMGIVGIEGVYRRCCEQTLKVVRNCNEAILTIVEVLLYDPISAWTISVEKAKKVQIKEDPPDVLSGSNTLELPPLDGVAIKSSDDESKNKMAERVLLRLKQKLSGSDSGTSLAVDGQINYLIQEARCTRNLCQLFPGWQPWL